MSDNEPKALIVRPTSGLQQHDSGAEKVLSRIVSDALTIARGQDIADTSARIRIGKYEFREQDYQQILIWAQEAGKTPEDLVSILENVDIKNKEFSFLVDDGAIKHLTLPHPKQFEFPQRRLQISHLPNLTKIWCAYSMLTKLEFFCKSALEKLYCSSNNLANLDLSNIPALTFLCCEENQLTELDLSNVPALTHLFCSKNHLAELDLSNVPALAELRCWGNRLTGLNLSNIPALTDLWCSGNQLTGLDLSNVPALTHLYCIKNQLTELDLSNVPALTHLDCSENQLTKLDLSKVPALTELRCAGNQLTELDLSNNERLVGLIRVNNKFRLTTMSQRLSCDSVVSKVWNGSKLKHEWQSFSDCKMKNG